MKEIDDFREAGKIAAKVREASKKLIMVDASLLDIAETIEQMIEEEGAKPAFPVNISINEIAAHYTPEYNCEKTLQEGDLVKIDLGVALNGALSDTAYTLDLSGSAEHFIKAAEDALNSAISSIKPGVSVGEVGGVIEDSIRKHNLKPIANLTGHQISSNSLHAGVELPNIKTNNPYRFKEGDVFAVEPFVTDGAGYVEDLEQVEIFALYAPGKIRLRQSRKIVEHVWSKYGFLPFAERWIRKEFKSKLLVSAALQELLETHTLRAYPVLREVEKGRVAQMEHTVLVTENGCEVLTK